MPRPKAKSSSSTSGKSESIAGFFTPIFAANRILLKTRSNKKVLAMWLEAHPGYKEVPENVKSRVANVKSKMRSKLRKRQGKKAVAEVAAGTAKAQSSPLVSADAIDTGLEKLEMLIDECLTMARGLERKGLDNVVGALRIARNRVVWKLGEE